MSTKTPQPVIVCTDKRAVVFGYTADIQARPITLTKARMCLSWPCEIGGVLGLGEIGPDTNTKISAEIPAAILEGITAIFSVTEAAESAWQKAKVQGR